MKIKIRKRNIIIFVLLVFALLILVIAGFLAYNKMKKSAIEECAKYSDTATRNLCYSSASIKYHDLGICNLSSDKDACLINYAVKYKKLSICKDLGFNSNWCIMNVAIAKKDASLCNSLDFLREQCESRVNEAKAS